MYSFCSHTVFYHANEIGFHTLNPLAPFSNNGLADDWFLSFVQKLLDHDVSVWSLVKPIKEGKNISDITYIRAERALYRMTNNLTSPAWWKVTDREDYLMPVCSHNAEKCGKKNCLALCLYAAKRKGLKGEESHCKDFVQKTKCVSPKLHINNDPSLMLVEGHHHHDEFRWHWINSLPNSYLLAWNYLYNLKTGKDEELGKLERYSDTKLVRWALQVHKSCAEGLLKDRICERLN